MYPYWGLTALPWPFGWLFGQTISCFHFFRVIFILMGGPKYQHDDSLGPCAFIHYISTLFPPTYDMGRLIDGKFRKIPARIDDLMSIWMLRGGRCKIYDGTLQLPRWMLSDIEVQLLFDNCIKRRHLAWSIVLYTNALSFVMTRKIIDQNKHEYLYATSLAPTSSKRDGQKCPPNGKASDFTSATTHRTRLDTNSDGIIG